MPVVHVVHDVCPRPSAKVPYGHGVQGAFPVALNVPSRHTGDGATVIVVHWTALRKPASVIAWKHTS